MSTTTFGTINNIQFVTNRSNLVDNTLDNGGNLSKSHNFQNIYCSGTCENHLQDNSNRNKFVANGKAGVISPCTPNGLSYCNSFVTKGTVVSPSMSSCSMNSRFSSGSSNSSSFKGSDSMSSGLAVEESPTGTIRFATDRPHLVSMGGGRLSTSVTLHPINEGKTVLGSGGMGVVPDIPVLGTGVEPEHCLLENKDGSVFLTPLAPMVAIDGLKITSKTKLTQGCMICLGRSHYFRFNHPSEAKLMRSILPNARISMAPITFYPAVDNPEYFHMTAQEAAGSGEEIRVHNDESPPPNRREEERGSSHPPVPPRKNPPPSTLTLPLSENTAVDSQNNKQSCHASSPSESAPKSSSEECSDSESPPEVPPRSEGTCPTYVNTTAATLLSPNPKSSATYLGEYIYTKAEEDLSTTTNSLKTKETSSNQFALSPTSVITHNGMTMAHNAMYRSIPASLSSQEILQSRSPVGSPTACSSQFTFFTATSQHSLVSQPSSVVTSTSHCSVSPFTSNHSVGQYSSPRTPLPVTSECSPKICSTLGDSVTSPSHNSILNSRYANLGSPVGTLEKDLKLSEKKKQLAHEERLQEQAMASAEKARLEEILKMCAEYERQQNVGLSSIGSPTSADSTSTSKSSISPYQTLTQNRIKTNGSLPREKRSPLSSPPPSHMGISSPTGSVPPLLSPLSSSRRAGTPSEDELNSIFSFESDSGFNISNGASATNRSDHSCPYPPFPNLSSGLEGTPSPPPISPRSPYENISHNHHMGYPMPQSPRTRIRTIVGKDRRDHCEVFENKMAFGDSHSPQTYSSSNSCTSSCVSKAVSKYTPKENGLSEKAPVKPPRSPRINRKVLVDDDDDDLSKTKDFNIIDNKYFADVTPKAKANQTNSKNYNTKHFNDEENSKISAAKRNCLPAFTSELNSSPSRSKVFEEHMIRNIQESLNINDIASEVEKLNREKNEALKETVRLKGKINDLESQENEALRELELERALLDGELDCLRYSLEVDEESLSQLLKKSTEMDKRHQDDRAKDKETINNCKMRLELAEKELDNVGKNEGSLSEKELKEKSELEKQKHETVETERKIFEDTEFSQMESEALRESEREELNKEICDLKEKILSQKEKAAELEKQMVDITSSVRTEADCLETERQKLLLEVNKVMLHVSNVDRQMAELARLGAIPPVPNGRLSPTASSSDSEESTGTDLVDRLAQLHLLDQSQEDLDRINQIATLSPLEYREGTLGRKTSAALMEVERNRQLNLVKQGTQVINDEKRRVEELKRKVAHKVKAEWEERRKEKAEREVACASLDSVGSEESSSLTSSDMHAESLSSDDVIAHRNSGGDNSAKETNKVRQRDSETPPDFGEQSRPLSDASSSYDADVQPPVRYREKGKTQQRPLTRYLPVRSEEHFDLRQHIESAGHQIELCPYLSLNQMSCRGYLHKLGSKFRTWQKRWFVFDRSKRAFLYYSDKSESKPRGGTYFQAIEDVYVDHHSVKSPSPKLVFCVKTHDRTYQLMAPSPEAMRIWIDVIFTGAEGYQEFQGGT